MMISEGVWLENAAEVEKGKEEKAMAMIALPVKVFCT